MMRGSIKPLIAQLDNERARKTDHAGFLAEAELTRRPEQLSVQEFVALTNRLAAEYC